MVKKSSTIIQLFIGLAAMFGVTWVYAFMVAPYLSGLHETLFLVIKSMLVPYLIGLPLFLAITFKMPKEECKTQKSIKFSILIKYFIIQSGLGMLGFFMANIIITLTIGSITQEMDIKSNWIFYLVLLLIFNPIMEELVFRKFVLERLRIHGDRFAMLTSAILFALPHMSVGFPQAIYAFILGYVWSHIVIRTGHLREAIILHAISNIIGAILPILLSNPINGHTIFLSIYFIVFNLICPLISLFILVKDRKIITEFLQK